MIKINKFNNVYGIRELKNTDLINGNTLIYAPNGVMKTSFSDGLRDIISGDMPKDVFTNPNIISEFELENNGVIVSSNDSNFTIDAFVFNVNDYNNDIFSDPRIGSLVMSNSLKVKYKTILDKYLKVKNDFNLLISKDVLGRKKVDENDFNFLSNIFGSNDFVKVLEGLPNLNEYTDEYYGKIAYLDLFNEKVEAIISSSEFIDKCNNYNSYIDIELDQEVFNSGFSFDSLQKILKEFKTNNFFKAGHKVSLKSKGEMGENELLNYINSIVKKVYGSDEAQKLFNEAKAVLDKNPNTRKLISTIKENPRHLKEISNLTNFKKNIIFTKMNGNKDYIDNLRKELEEYRNALEEIVKEAESASETWKKVLDNYNSRFITNKFDVEIENLTDAVLNLKPPVFKRKIKGTNQEITTEIFNRFSSGEKRAVLILNLMFEIELRKNKQFTLVLDDVSDSFDYKNKYAIIECLKDFSEYSNIQLIILTHNFDFYRSLRIALKDTLQSKLLAYSNNGQVTLYDARQKHFEDYSYYSNWKNNGKLIDFIFIIPFLRNIIQLEKNSKDPDYQELTKLLHYNSDLENKIFADFESITNKYNIKANFDLNQKYLSCIKIKAEEIINSAAINETNLQEKVVLGIFIRLFTDKYMWNKYVEKHGIDPEVSDVKNQSRYLYNLISNNIDENKKSILLTAFTIAPSFVHINSFMFEPLIDVGTEKLIDISKKVLTL